MVLVNRASGLEALRDIMFASMIANILALAAIIFSMQVYDRVVPSQSIPTLWVLAGGVLIAAIFEFVLRISRVYFIDIIGKRADLRIQIRSLAMRSESRTVSVPSLQSTFISRFVVWRVCVNWSPQHHRSIADLPFFFLFLVIFALIGGNLFWVMLVVVPLMILPGILVQKNWPNLRRKECGESSIRNAILVEAVRGIGDIKLLRAESVSRISGIT